METVGNAGLGNTKLTLRNLKRCVPCKRWCFTLNNYTDNELETLETIFKPHKYIIGREVGEKSRIPHLQGYVEFNTKVRPIEKIPIKRIHWEKCKGSRADNITYCSKQGDYVSKGLSISVDDPLLKVNLYEWQNEIIQLIKSKPDPRKIYWYWEHKGNVGKTALAKHICIKYNALYVSGSANNIKYAITQWIDKCKTLDVVIYGVPRSQESKIISYEILESIKDGIFFSTKYESGMVLFNTPHVIVFANFPPEEMLLSIDRWCIKQIS